jgi:predicted porin
MKKSLVALAALAVAGIASAQSSVTLFGVLDAGVSGYSNKSDNRFGSATVSSTQLTNSGYNSSRLGFRGTEDLGGGLAASFWLEAGINNDDGTGAATGGGLQFNRRSTVSLSGAFGEVRLGRDYTPTFWNDTVFDPFGTNGVGTNLISTANGYGPGFASGFTGNNNYVRASNSVGYFLPPNLGGFYGQAMYAFSESTKYDPGVLTPNVLNSQRAGRYIGARGGWANGPIDVALAYGESTVADDFFGGLTTKLDTWNLGGSYDFGVVKLYGEYSDSKLKTDRANPSLVGLFGLSDPAAKGWLLGATVPVGPGLIRASYSAVDYKQTNNVNQVFGLPDPKADKFALGYVHNLSKRTALYATVAWINNKDGAALTTNGTFYALPAGTPVTAANTLTPKSSTGYDFGIRHAF